MLLEQIPYVTLFNSMRKDLGDIPDKLLHPYRTIKYNLLASSSANDPAGPAMSQHFHLKHYAFLHVILVQGSLGPRAS